jgi:hypothetical protein
MLLYDGMVLANVWSGCHARFHFVVAIMRGASVLLVRKANTVPVQYCKKVYRRIYLVLDRARSSCHSLSYLCCASPKVLTACFVASCCTPRLLELTKIRRRNSKLQDSTPACFY